MDEPAEPPTRGKPQDEAAQAGASTGSAATLTVAPRSASGGAAQLQSAVTAGRQSLLAGMVAAIAATLLANLWWPGRVAAAGGAIALGLAMGVSVIAGALASRRRGARLVAGPRPVRVLFVRPVLLLGIASLLVAGGHAVETADAEARAEARAAAAEIASLGARLLATRPRHDPDLEPWLTALAPKDGWARIAPPGSAPTSATASGSATSGSAASGSAASGSAASGSAASRSAASGSAASGSAASGSAASGATASGSATSGSATSGSAPSSPALPAAEDCRLDRAALPCASQPLEGGARLIVASPPASLSPALGRLLVRGGLVLLALLLLAGALARAVSSYTEAAAAELLRTDDAPSAAAPEQLTRALASVRRRSASMPPVERPPIEPDLLQTVSAQLRAPLDEIDEQAAALAGLSTLMPEQAEDVALIRASNRELHALVDAVLDLSAIHTGELVLARAPVDLLALASEVTRALRPQLEQRELSLVIDAPTAVPPVMGDARRLRQVITNLTSNAVKFSERGRITVTLVPDGEQVELSVRDQGPGIAASALPQLFRPYEQAGDSRSRARGTGLGLAICKRFVEAHGGAISVESRVGVGTVFRVRLPRGGAAGGAIVGEPA